jgi:hypothetical protein
MDRAARSLVMLLDGLENGSASLENSFVFHNKLDVCMLYDPPVTPPEQHCPVETEKKPHRYVAFSSNHSARK